MPNEKINELKVKLSGTVNIPRELLTNATLDLKINNADCLDYRLINKQDGSFDKVFNVKISELSEVEFIKDTEKMLGEKKKSVSKRLRNRIWIWANDNDATDFEALYEITISKIINNLDEVMMFLKNK